MEAQKGVTVGGILGVAAAVMFAVYVGYRISRKRDELRETIQLLTGDHCSFVDGLEGLVKSGELCAQ